MEREILFTYNYFLISNSHKLLKAWVKSFRDTVWTVMNISPIFEINR